MATAAKKPIPNPDANTSLPGTFRTRAMVKLVLRAGNFGTGINAIETALRNEYKRLTGADINAALSAEIGQ